MHEGMCLHCAVTERMVINELRELTVMVAKPWWQVKACVAPRCMLGETFLCVTAPIHILIYD